MGRIVRVEAWPVNVPLETPYLMAIGRYPGMSRTVVRVTTADGVVGLGETGSAADADALNGELGAGLVGRETDELRTTLGRADLPRPDHRSEGRMTTAGPLTGVEIALWDIAGHEAEQPLYDLLGGAIRREIPFTEYFAYREGIETTRTDVARYCARMIEQHDSPTFEGKVAVRPPEDDVKLVREIRAAIGTERMLRLDANTGWRLETAARLLPMLKEHDIANVEEPVASFHDLKELRRHTSIPFSAHTPDVDLASALGVPDTLVLGVGTCGGIGPTRRIVADCEARGVGFWFYSGDLGITTAAHLHLAAATENLDQPSQSLLRWTADDVVMGGPFVPRGGVVTVPDGPGLGVSLDAGGLERAVERFAREGAYDYYPGQPPPRY